MKSLRFEKLELLSLVENKARAIKFHPRITVIKGANDVGKSSVIKSLYWAFGAEPKSIHKAWRDANVKAMVSFNIDGTPYSILRSRDTFGIFDGDGKLLLSTASVTKDLAPFIADLIDFRLVLNGRSGQPEMPPPAYAFLPFYVNQEGGWERAFNSFDYLGQYPDFRQSIIEYHSGILGNDYYELAAEKRKLALDQDEISRDRKAVAKAIEKLGIEVTFTGLELNAPEHEQSVEQILAHMMKIRAVRQRRAAELADVLDQRQSLESQVKIARQAISELEKDATYAAALDAEEVLCPTCGTSHENGFANRFGILDDREACFEFLTSSREKLLKLAEVATVAARSVHDVDAFLDQLQTLLAERKSDVSIGEIIQSEGKRTARSMLDEQIRELDEQVGRLVAEISAIDIEMKELKKLAQKDDIEGFFAELMLKYLEELDVKKIDHAVASKIDGRAKESGSDLPRAVLAYDLAFLQTVHKYSKAFTAPAIFDSPNQQDQDDVNVAKMIKLIFSERPEDGQTILGTVSLHEVEIEDGMVIEFDEKLSVLKESYFSEIQSRLQPFLAQMQA
ncbi:hypothetical protein [Agrobacterium sp. lyk4-40-TYG-31]|uniref:hypothetical protein n=1 Tax=Agrobacterium sp. lyk4-40-TYG-31 TaxID=3040276 RepID=UPI00254DDC69|nr:hypothetical protein [Agrobacterium sp. lyk4-40-TYG-31]